jgi:small multidrug resistance pump
MHPMIILLFAILTEVVGTVALKFSQSFTKLIPSLVVVLGYGISFYLFAVALNKIPLGAAYAIWAGVGTAGTILISLYLLHERMDFAMIAGVVLILIGVLVIGFFSRSIAV